MMNLLKKNKFYIVLSIIISLYSYMKIGNKFLPIERLSVASAIGYDAIKKGDGENVNYVVPISVYTYPKDEVSTITISGEAGTIPETREVRQTQSTGKFIVGLERVLVIGETAAKFGIRNIFESLFANRTVNDTAFLMVSKQKSEDILKFKVEGYPSSGEYLEGIIQQARDFNFAPNNYKILDAYVRLISEGRNLALPYIEIENDRIRVSGMALFKGEKMIAKLDMSDSKIMNLLREDKVKGIITIKKDAKEYTNFYGTSKRKVSCSKKDDKFIFNIEISLKGEIVSNSIYPNVAENPEVIKKIEEDVKKEVETVCMRFLEKMQSEYKVDALELGRYGVAVHGHGSGIDWDEEVSQAEINVNVKVKITEIGRGDY
jgi:Ger(x)C family germination protein